MFVRAYTIVLAIAASVIANSGDSTVNQCNNGPVQCCNNMMTSDDAEQSLGIENIGGMVGLDCSPILGSGASCTSQSVCCSGTRTNGPQIAFVGCDPINLGL